MSEELEDQTYWEDDDLQVPAALGAVGIPAEWPGLYFKMKAFGPQARAGINALARRCEWGRDKTRRIRQELWKSGWLFLMVEGHGGVARGKKGKKPTPRHWWMCKSPFQTPPAALSQKLGITKFPVQLWEATGFQEAPENQCTDFTDSPNSVAKGSKTLKGTSKEPKREAGANAPPPNASLPTPNDNLQAEAILLRLDSIRRASSYGRNLSRYRTTDAALAAGKVYGDDLEASYRAFLADDSAWLAKRKHPLHTFAAQADSYRTTPAGPAKQAKGWCGTCLGKRRLFNDGTAEGVPCPACSDGGIAHA